MDTTQSIGILGGTFNPIHAGHLQLAHYAFSLCNLSAVWFVPVFSPAHKNIQDIPPFEERCKALQQRIGDDSRFAISTIEEHLTTPSYSVHTYAALTQKYPNYCFFWITGSTDFLSLHTWFNGVEFLRTINTIIAPRQQHSTTTLAEETTLQCEQTCFSYATQYLTITATAKDSTKTVWHTQQNKQHIFLQSPFIPLSSTELRTLRTR